MIAMQCQWTKPGIICFLHITIAKSNNAQKYWSRLSRISSPRKCDGIWHSILVKQLLHVDGYKLDKRYFRHITPYLDRKQQAATGHCFQHSCLPAAYVCAKSSDRMLIRPVCALHCTVNSFYHRSWLVHLVTSQKIRKTDMCCTVAFLNMFFNWIQVPIYLCVKIKHWDDTLWPYGCIRLLYYAIWLSPLIKFDWKHWIYKCMSCLYSV